MESRPWYRKKRYLVPVGLFAGVYSVGFMAGNPTPAPAAEAIVPIVQEASVPVETAPDPVVKTREVVPMPISEPAVVKIEAQAQTQTVAPITTRQEPAPTQTPAPVRQSCNPNYSGCLKPEASDYDCAGGSGDGPYYTGTVQVIGTDEYKLDMDGDGWACDK